MPYWLNCFLRRFTKHVMNPVTLRSAGRGNYQYAALRHVGRKSGRPYVTPLAAEPVGGGFVIPLLYGEDTDWCRNLLAAGKGALAGGCGRWHVVHAAAASAGRLPGGHALGNQPDQPTLAR
jgi:deazaflavin-dependent oxidoreductase (nitroreductase family)